MRYSHRKYLLMMWFVDEATVLEYGSYGHCIMRASIILDEKRNVADASTTAYLNHLKINVPRGVKKLLVKHSLKSQKKSKFCSDCTLVKFINIIDQFVHCSVYCVYQLGIR